MVVKIALALEHNVTKNLMFDRSRKCVLRLVLNIKWLFVTCVCSLIDPVMAKYVLTRAYVMGDFALNMLQIVIPNYCNQILNKISCKNAISLALGLKSLRQT
jgi:phage-related holin